MRALAFRNTEFEIIDRNNQPWLRSPQIAGALGYADESSINRIYARNAGEFTDNMTCTVKLTDQTQDREVRIFSLRGAHLLAMLSRTAVAKEFRRWVLDILEGVTEASNEPRHSPTLLGTTIGTDGFRCLGAVLDGKLNKLPAKAKQRAKMHIWSQVHKAFSVVSAQDIPAEQMDSVRNFIAAYTLEGEWLAKADSITTASTRRWLISRDHAGNEQRTPVPDDACVMSTRQMLDAIVRPGELGISTDEMHQFAMAALSNLKMRLDNQSLLLKQMRASGLRA